MQAGCKVVRDDFIRDAFLNMGMVNLEKYVVSSETKDDDDDDEEEEDDDIEEEEEEDEEEEEEEEIPSTKFKKRNSSKSLATILFLDLGVSVEDAERFLYHYLAPIINCVVVSGMGRVWKS